MTSVERNPSFKIMSLVGARRSGIKKGTNAGTILVQEKTVPDSSEFMRVKKMFAVLADNRSPGGKKPFA